MPRNIRATLENKQINEQRNEQLTERETRKADRYMKKFPKFLGMKSMSIRTQRHFIRQTGKEDLAVKEPVGGRNGEHPVEAQ